MSIVLQQTVSGGSGGYVNSFTITLGAVTVGQTILINTTSGNTDTYASFVDSLGNTYTLDIGSVQPTAGERQSNLWRANVTTGGTPTITITYTAGQFVDTAYIARVYSGLNASAPLDKTSSNNDGTSFLTTHDAGTTAATTQADELVILFGGTSGSASPGFAAGTGYSNGLEQKGFDAFTYAFMSDKIVAATGAQSGNFTSVSNVRGQAAIATYKALASTPATSTPYVPQLAMLGVG